jgi:hypothetical protein
MDQAVAKILSIVALETLKKMAFIFGTYEEDDAITENEGQFLGVQVDFKGPFSGTLALNISETILPELAGNMLGIDETGPISIDHQQDALREIANVVCGRLLPLIDGREAEFTIDQPQILGASSSGKGHSLPGTVARVKLDLEEGMCDIALAVDGTLPEELTPEAVEVTKQTLEWDTL